MGLEAATIQSLVGNCFNILTTDSHPGAHLHPGRAGRGSSEQGLPGGAAGWGCLASTGEVAQMGQPASPPPPEGRPEAHS